jgi:hypothetical protein
MVSDRERAAFEAGIKLGALYHQFVGTPVSPASAETLERAVEAAVSLQPCVEKVRVELDRSQMSPNAFGYSEVRGTMFRVEITTRAGNARCMARLSCEQDYPLMTLVRCEEGSPVSHHR